MADAGVYLKREGELIPGATVPGPKGDKGDKGDTGAPGANGPANTLTVGTVVTGPTTDVEIIGEAPAQTINFVLQKGDKGDQGIQGIQGVKGDKGTAATITLGTVTTGAPGSSVIITNTGDSSQAVLNFTIPRGDNVEWLSDTGAPASGTGGIGDFYLNRTNGDVYEKTDATTWVLRTNIVGPAGAGSIDTVNGYAGPDVVLGYTDVGAEPSGAVSSHESDTTNIHGITDTANLVYTNDARLSDARTPVAHTHPSTEVTGTFSASQLAAGTQTANYVIKLVGGVPTWAADSNTTYAVPSQAEAEAGTATTGRAFSAERVKQAIIALAAVKSVAGKTGVITLAKADVGLSNVDNTSDANKPISTATQTALDGKANTSHTHAAADVADVVTTNTNQTISGGKTFTSAITSLMGGGGLYMRATGVQDHVYISFSARAATADRTGWLGYGSNGSINFDMRNEITNGNINLSTAGTGVVQANGQTIVTTNDARLSDARTPTAHTHAQSDITGLSTALAGKEGTIAAGTTAQYWRGDKSWQTLNKAAVGLSNVDNTSDANKPISTATQTALNDKVNNSALAVANGVATLDANTKIPIVLIPTGNTATTVVIGNDPRLSDARTPTAHTHVKADITDFAHTHAITDVTNLQSSLDAKAAAVHSHSASDITSGIISQDRLTVNIVRVVHNGTDYPARPTGATYVEWVGPTEPPAAVANDTWVSTA